MSTNVSNVSGADVSGGRCNGRLQRTRRVDAEVIFLTFNFPNCSSWLRPSLISILKYVSSPQICKIQGEVEVGGTDWRLAGKSSLLDTPVPNPTSRVTTTTSKLSTSFSTTSSSSITISTPSSQNPSKFVSNTSMLSCPSPVPNSCRLGVTKGPEGVLAKQVNSVISCNCIVVQPLGIAFWIKCSTKLNFLTMQMAK